MDVKTGGVSFPVISVIFDESELIPLFCLNIALLPCYKINIIDMQMI